MKKILITKKTVIKKIIAKMICFAAVLVLIMGMCITANAASSAPTILRGVFIGDVDVSGMTGAEAKAAVNKYVDSLKKLTIILNIDDEHSEEVTAGDLGLKWKNPYVVEEALNLARTGNVLRRFREARDLERINYTYEVELSFDDDDMREILEERCAVYDQPGERATIRRENGSFIVEGGTEGRVLDVDASVKKLNRLLRNGWNDDTVEVDLVVKVESPEIDREAMEQVTDLLGTFTTSYSSSGSDRSANVSNGCAHINGTLLFPGDEFSAYKTVSPFTEENGYHMAGSYSNGLVVESLGGGICQVSTTLYNAVIRAELEIVERHNHSMEVSYVDPSADAAIAESAGKDFRFRNSTDYPIYIEGKTVDKKITFNIYGVETRSPGRKLEFKSEILSETVPEGTKIVADRSQPVGYVKSQSVHVGRTAKLWKIVTENGREVEREAINKSVYAAVPRTLSVGTATSDARTSELIRSAIATGDADYVKNAAASLKRGDMTLGGTIPTEGTAAETVTEADALTPVIGEEALPVIPGPEIITTDPIFDPETTVIIDSGAVPPPAPVDAGVVETGIVADPAAAGAELAP